MRLKRILVPIDFSTHSLNALSHACGLAQQFGAELFLLHVIEPIQFITVSDVYDEQRRRSDAELTRLGDALARQGVKVHIRVEPGVPSHVIVQAAKNGGVDMISIGTHGRTGLAHMLIGSVAERVVRSATCPVLTVRHAVRWKSTVVKKR